jgi:hypothetical protein
MTEVSEDIVLRKGKSGKNVERELIDLFQGGTETETAIIIIPGNAITIL